MEKNKKGIAIVVASIFVLFLFAFGYRHFSGRPSGEGLNGDAEEKKSLELEDQNVPAIPQKLGVEERQEPVLQVFIAETGKIVSIPFEEYLQGVVAAEMETDWPLEALAAQAIVARTFTLQKIAEKGGVPARGAHASTDIKEFQAYNADKITEKVRQAVEKTRGKVVIKDGEFIRAWFHAYAGPKTALADEGLDFQKGNPTYIQIVDSPGIKIIPPEERDWLASFPLEQVRQVVKASAGEDPGSVQSIEIAGKGPSGRAVRIKINDVEISGPEFRLGLGSTEVRSTLFSGVNIKEGRVVLEGTGYGHGVGLCQWGARAMAEEGETAEDIIKHFYKDVKIAKLWD